MDLRFREPVTCDIFPGEPAVFSPDCRFIAMLASNATIHVKNALTLENVTVIECPGPISSFQWSPDAKLLLVIMKNLNSLQIYFVEKTRSSQNHLTPSFAGISAGKIDTERAIWMQDSNTVLIFGALAAQMFAWNVSGKKVRKLPPPKNTLKAISCSPDGSMIAELVRKSDKDVLVVMDSRTFGERMQIPLSTLDATTVEWAADGSFIVVVDDITRNLMQFIDVKEATIAFSHSAYDGYLGITHAEICPDSKIVAVAGFDDCLRLLVAPDWHVLTEFMHEAAPKLQGASVFKEEGTSFVSVDGPVRLRKSDNEEGMKTVSWAVANQYLASVSAKFPETVFIWKAEAVSLVALIILSGPVAQIEWSPVEEVLGITRGAGFVCTWSPRAVAYTATSSSLRVQTFAWRADGTEILALDRSAGEFSIACRR